MSGKKAGAGMINMGAAIGLCAAVGVALGALLNNLVWGLCAGAGVGVVLGAVLEMRRRGGT